LNNFFEIIKTPESFSPEELIESLKNDRVKELYYYSFPPNVKELMIRQGIVFDLVEAYSDKDADALFRFNILLILNHRGALLPSEKHIIIACLEGALEDSSAWVRTEAVWGLQFVGDASSYPKIIKMLDDTDSNVKNETITTLSRLTGITEMSDYSDDIFIEEPTEEEFWKYWWFWAKLKKEEKKPFEEHGKDNKFRRENKSTTDRVQKKHKRCAKPNSKIQNNQ